MHTTILKLIISICVFAIVAQAQTTSKPTRHVSPQAFTVSGNHELETISGEKDYMLPGEGFANKSATNSRSMQTSTSIVSSSFPAESIVEYKSFTFGTTFSLHAFNGKYVQYLMADTMIGTKGLSRDEIRELVDLTDVLYAHMAEIVGGEPSGDGLLTIALLNPGRDFGGRGWVGSKGVEMYEGYALRYRKDFLAGCVPNPVVHEMAHNFDIYNAYISHDGDNYHAWTAFLIPYVQYYTQTGASWAGNVVNPTSLLDQTIDSYTDPWDASGISSAWVDCVKRGTGCEDKRIYANTAWAGLLLRFARLHKPSALRKAFVFVKGYRDSHAIAPATAEAKNDLLVSALADGAQINLQGEMETWNWAVSSEVSEQMKRAFPGTNAFSTDADNDHFTPAQGDRDDFNSAINPGAIEKANGIDDDSNGIVDDVILQDTSSDQSDYSGSEVLSIPGHVVGQTATTTDSDTYQIEIATPRSINIWAKGMRTWFSGWVELRYANDPDSTTPIYISMDYPGNTVVPFDRVGTWTLKVMPWSGAGEGYEIFLSEINPAELSANLRFEGSRKHDFLMANVTLAQNVGGQTWPAEVRLWAEGLGFIDRKAFSPVTMFKWNSPSSTQIIRLRAQFLSDNSPVSATTAAISGSSERTWKVISPMQGIATTIQPRLAEPELLTTKIPARQIFASVGILNTNHLALRKPSVCVAVSVKPTQESTKRSQVNSQASKDENGCLKAVPEKIVRVPVKRPRSSGIRAIQ